MTTETKDIKNRTKDQGGKLETTTPVHVVRRGAIAASIWRRQAPSGFPYYDFSLSRSWKSLSTSKTGYSKNFFADHEQELVEVIRETCAWIAARKQEDQATAAPGTLAA
jgi:hypothetical protein